MYVELSGVIMVNIALGAALEAATVRSSLDLVFLRRGVPNAGCCGSGEFWDFGSLFMP